MVPKLRTLLATSPRRCGMVASTALEEVFHGIP